MSELTAKQQNMVEITQKAYESSIEAIDIGVPLHEIASIAKNILDEAGYPWFHGLGHGIGLTPHDYPSVNIKPTNPIGLEYWQERKVEEGMVFTIEPGIYIMGEGGYRIENDVMIRNGKVNIITSAKFEHIE